MQPGPAAYFTKEQLTITPEPALAAGFDKVEAPGADDVDADLGKVEQSFNEALTYLQTDALSWQDTLDQVSGTLDSDLADSPTGIDPDILASRPFTQDAIDGAESSFLPDAYQDKPPWYTPPPEVGTDTQPPPSKEEE